MLCYCVNIVVLCVGIAPSTAYTFSGCGVCACACVRVCVHMFLSYMLRVYMHMCVLVCAHTTYMHTLI